MTLVAAGRAQHPVTRLAVDFLRRNVRPDGSWPIDTNLATWLTTLSVGALASDGRLCDRLDAADRATVRTWLLEQQTSGEHPFTGAAPGAWGWTDLPGGVPDADDTPGALLALHSLGPGDDPEVIRRAAAAGVDWLLNLQNRDGGMPTFCRGWGALPFDRSGADITAHAVRAWLAWRTALDATQAARVDVAVSSAVAYLLRAQRADGAFVPLWFGSQHAKDEENATYGTARVLMALVETDRRTSAPVEGAIARAAAWLIRAQNEDGGWGGVTGTPSSIEETSLAVSALAELERPAEAGRHDGTDARAAIDRGIEWVRRATSDGTVFSPAPIGFYFAKLWYYEHLYPVTFATEALLRAGASGLRSGHDASRRTPPAPL